MGHLLLATYGPMISWPRRGRNFDTAAEIAHRRGAGALARRALRALEDVQS
jgi:hypothetical protein